MASIATDVFTKHGVRFRGATPGECLQSEINFFCNDIWRVYENNTRVAVDPLVVSYRFDLPLHNIHSTFTVLSR